MSANRLPCRHKPGGIARASLGSGLNDLVPGKHLDRLGGCWGGMLHDDDLQAWRLAGAGLALLFLGDVADLLKRLRLPDSPLTMAAPVFPTRSEDCGMREARKTGETARVGAGTAGALPWRARGAAPHSSQEKRSIWAKRQRRPLAGPETG